MNIAPGPGSRLARRVLRSLVLALVLLTALVGPVGPVSAAVPPATTLTLSAPPSGKAGQQVPFTAVLKDEADAALLGVTVTLERLSSSWKAVATGTTDGTGHVVVGATLPAGVSTWRASYAGDANHAPSVSSEVPVTGQVLPSTLSLSGPTRLVDERTATLRASWKASDGTPVDGVVTVRRRLRGGGWTDYKRLRTTNGTLALRVRPRTDSRWRLRGAAGPWWKAAASSFLTIDNLPPVTPVAYPRAAPHPRSTAAQARATGAGAHPVITRVSSKVWRSMVGRTWHRGCPVGRSRLRLLRVNYWGFDGYRYRGEMVLSSAVVRRAAGALRDMYDGHYPIRRMYRVDHFGYNKALHGGNDYASMRADNTSGFNCRSVVNKPRVLSPHARGRAVDLNTWENPYRSATGLVPDKWWASHSDPRMAWRSSAHPVVRIWRAHGFRWTYGNVDSQHVDGRRTTTVAGTFTG
jgi:hypothetical protein